MTDLTLLNLPAQSIKVFREIYGDLAKPGVQQVGKALGTTLGLGNTILWPVHLLNETTNIILKKNLEKFRRKMENTPLEEVSEVTPEVGVPIAEKLSYVTNEELSEMYTELLAKASQYQNANTAHPSFVNIINNLSPDEAILIKSIRRALSIPFVSVRLYKKGKAEWTELHPMVLNLPCLSVLAYPDNVPAYISNLEGLGLLNIQNMFSIAKDELYKPLEENANTLYADFAEKLADQVLKCDRGKIDITSFGRLFLQACFSNN